MEAKVKLSVLGFSFNQSKSGTYGLVLSEEDGLRRLMIVVGTPEAQSIAFKLHNTNPPRPLSHDLVQSILKRFAITLKEIFIYKYDDGIFFSHLVFNQNGQVIEIESRTSDAIAIALRTDSPIYTTEDIMRRLAVVVQDADEESKDTHNVAPTAEEIQENEINYYSVMSDEELNSLLNDALAIEDYELASIIRDEIRKKKTKRKKA
ncbi:bifunctional DNase/RNase [Dysgonomonas sp. PH5-45]|uniref:bifunctional nuclease family protein n=1 Tax=unclassified Dysgonomonas TaxID=2630389 RepID=UPI002473F95D|nr:MULTISPECIES: bifunctional nuclease family protein [unclassified Dysgonomonas]MDH6354294.1 bifunctional DNase/RNase [Dysgonomonas sp. PH5-45]MDH6387195.1 bifunctional DNase/RNase [Dysgonomonas sp. PH5-37]